MSRILMVIGGVTVTCYVVQVVSVLIIATAFRSGANRIGQS